MKSTLLRVLSNTASRLKHAAIVTARWCHWQWDGLCFAGNMTRTAQNLFRSPLWQCARQVVQDVARDRPLQEVVAYEPYTTFCPRCGQLPDGDRRFEEARELVLKHYDASWPPFKRNELDFALAYFYWRYKAKETQMEKKLLVKEVTNAG